MGSSQRANRLIGWLLRSSFAGVLESSVMLLTVRGGRTGRRHTFPVQYARHGPVLWVLAGGHEHKTWWRNLLEECPVRLLVRGQQRRGLGRAVCGETEVRVAEQGLRVYLRRFPRAARRLGVGGAGGLDPERLRSLAARSVMVRIQLAPGEGGTVAVAGTEERRVAGGRGIVGAVRRHPLGAFYLLTFLISWGYWVPDAIGGGHAQPSFRRRHRRLQASVLVAMPWVVWHLPTFFLDTGYRGSIDPKLLPGFVLGIFAGAIVLTWLYEGRGRASCSRPCGTPA